MRECGKKGMTEEHNPLPNGAGEEKEKKLPRLAYVPLWFPLSSETFIFREIQELRAQGMDVRLYTMYGERLKGCSQAMREYSGPVFRMGVKAFFPMWGAFFRALKKRPRLVWNLARQAFFKPMRNLEAQGENSWCFLAGFLLAEKCQADGVDLIHSPWANGPATAAMVASKLSGLPYAFTGRAGDIYPEDGLLRLKAEGALFIRANNAANVSWLASFCPPNEGGKVRLVYNGLTFGKREARDKEAPRPPYRILAVGRFARTKGFPYLLTAMARLRREGFPARLTLVGDGAWKGRLLRLRKRLNLENVVDMPGFVPNDKLAEYMRGHDLLAVPSVVHENGDRDGIPNVIMEAMSLGLPVVATDVCGIGEVARDGRTGRLIRQRDAGALAGAIRQTLENWPESAKMAEAGGKLVLEMFDSRKNSEALRDLYAAALQSRNNA